MGGFVGLIWGGLSLIFGGYEAFKLQTSLIGAVYPTSPQGRDESIDDDSDRESESGVPRSERAAKKMMLNTVAERGKYWYNYSEYLCISLLSSFCCCFVSDRKWFTKRLQKLKRHQEAGERLSQEIDIVKILYNIRLVQLIAKLTLKRH